MLLPSYCAHSRAELMMGMLPLRHCTDVNALKGLLPIVKIAINANGFWL